jgi:hypothetical protein
MSYQVPTATAISQPPVENFKVNLAPLIVGGSTVLAFVMSALLADGTKNLSTAMLLFLPVCAQIIGSLILWHRLNANSRRGNLSYYRLNLYASSASILSYCLLWLAYSNRWLISHPDLLQAVSLTALVFILLLLLLVGVMTAAFIMVSTDARSEKWVPRQCAALRAGIKEEPLWAIALFFILFLGVAYLFGFALAFHDRSVLVRTNNTKPALHMVNLKSADDTDSVVLDRLGGSTARDRNDSQQVASSTPVPTETEATSTEQEEFSFYFEEVKASVIASRAQCTTGNPKRIDSYIPRQMVFNTCSLQAIVATLQQALQKGERVRVSLVGHSDNEPIKVSVQASSRYLSNYELSEARAQSVQYEIMQSLRDRKLSNLENIDWVVFAAGDEPLSQLNRGAIREEMFTAQELRDMGLTPNAERKIFVNQIEKYLTATAIDHKLLPQEKRVVIATVERISENPVILRPEQVRNLTSGQSETLDKLRVLEAAQNEHIAQSQAKPLKLMDYMYFSIYTITTTGYGDIVPTTSYAKFVTSLANICEVLFLVVFFNALISIKADKEHHEQELGETRLRTQNEHPEDGMNQPPQPSIPRIAEHSRK